MQRSTVFELDGFDRLREEMKEKHRETKDSWSESEKFLRVLKRFWRRVELWRKTMSSLENRTMFQRVGREIRSGFWTERRRSEESSVRWEYSWLILRKCFS